MPRPSASAPLNPASAAGAAATSSSLPRPAFPCRPSASNAATQRYKLHRLTWHNPLFYLLLLANIIIYAIVALCVQHKADMHIPVCEAHYRKRRNWVLISWLIALAGVGMGIAGCAGLLNSHRTETLGGIGMAAGFITLIAGAILGIYAGRITYPKEIDAHWVHLGGAGEAFLSSLPSA